MITLTDSILSTVEKFHEGLHYYMIRDVQSVFVAFSMLKELGLTPHDEALSLRSTKKNWYMEEEHVYCGTYDFVLSGTETDDVHCNICNYNEPMKTIQFFVNKERGTFGRKHYGVKLNGYRWFRVG